MKKLTKNEIAIGNEYRRSMGAVHQYVTLVGYDNETKKYSYVTKSGKEGTTDEETILKRWELVKVAENAVDIVKKDVNVEARKNEITCLEAAIRTLVKRNVPMTAKELVKAMKEDDVFFFKPTAKTPWNSVGTRLSTYINKCLDNGEECRVKQTERGKFAHKDYVVEAVA